MKRLLLPLAIAALVLTASGCTRYKAPVVPPQGLLVTKLSAPLTVKYASTAVGTKKGQASTFYFHIPFITGADFAWGEAGLKKAGAAAGITQVAYADYDILMILGIFGVFTVTAYGE